MTNLNLPSATSGLDRLDPERLLALHYVPAPVRPAIAALWSLDAQLGTVVAAGHQLMLTQMKLAWWREALARLDEAPAPAEPMLVQVQEQLVARGLSGARLAEMTRGWEHLLADELVPDELQGYAASRGGLLFRFSAELLGSRSSASIESAGTGWALADLARRTSRSEERISALAMARERLDGATSWTKPLRPLGMLAVLARRDAASAALDLERQGSPKRVLRMFAHRLTGR